MNSSLMRYCLIGHPVDHSLSPRIHNTAFRALGLKAEYSLVDSSVRGLTETVAFLKEEHFLGWNVTMPDKTAMCDLCDELSEASRIGRSVNTVRNENGILLGDTTDGSGFSTAISSMGRIVRGSRIALLGTGGAASSILIECVLRQAKSVSVYYRSESSRIRFEELLARLNSSPERGSAEIRLLPVSSFRDNPALLCSEDLLVNATSAGMEPDTASCPLPEGTHFPSTLGVFDAIYHPEQTELLKRAKKAGCATANGFPMLLGQAAESFYLWTGRRMPEIKLSLLSSSSS